ncbi:proline-rich protein 23E [Bubalus kerabau]|uniref:proline-rich protein 23E n=1 Tax=Bubalus carabanensis TaxID=3119969 RepID=UPI00244E8C05|nr:proline-rich protein 23E [Bubalus carabanensis]
MGYPPPAASGPSIWVWGICSFDPLMGSQPSHLAPWTPRVFRYPVEPPPPYSSSPPTLGGDTPEPGAQRGWQPPPSSARLTAVGSPPRAASHVTMALEVLPSGGLPRSACGPQTTLQPRTLPSAPFPLCGPSAGTPRPPPPPPTLPGPPPPLLALICAWRPCPPVVRGRGVQ